MSAPAPPKKSVDPSEIAPLEARPISTVDVVIFSVRHERLCVLLVRRARPPFAGQWALPGAMCM